MRKGSFLRIHNGPGAQNKKSFQNGSIWKFQDCWEFKSKFLKFKVLRVKHEKDEIKNPNFWGYFSKGLI